MLKTVDYSPSYFPKSFVAIDYDKIKCNSFSFENKFVLYDNAMRNDLAPEIKYEVIRYKYYSKLLCYVNALFFFVTLVFMDNIIYFLYLACIIMLLCYNVMSSCVISKKSAEGAIIMNICVCEFALFNTPIMLYRCSYYVVFFNLLHVCILLLHTSYCLYSRIKIFRNLNGLKN